MMSRRRFLGSCAAAALGASLPADLRRPGALRCRPVISGPLWWYDPAQSSEWGVSGWRDELDEQSRLGFNLLWLTNAPSGLDNGLDSLMDLCAKRKVRVILDTGSSGVWYAPFDLKKELRACAENISRVGERFKGHPAFFAWYIPHEIYMSWPDEPGYPYIHKLYPELVRLCKRAAVLPVTLSPFFILDKDKVFGGFRYGEPAEYERFWAGLIKASGIDVIMLQDSGEHFSYVTNDQRRPFFEAMANACAKAGARFWGNVETAEYVCNSKEEFVRRFGRIHHSAARGLEWRPVPIERLKEKLELAAEYCEDIVTWGYREFCRPALGEAAKKWYNSYRAYAHTAGVRRQA